VITDDTDVARYRAVREGCGVTQPRCQMAAAVVLKAIPPACLVAPSREYLVVISHGEIDQPPSLRRSRLLATG